MPQNLFLGRREGNSKICLFESSGVDRPLRIAIHDIHVRGSEKLGGIEIDTNSGQLSDQNWWFWIVIFPKGFWILVGRQFFLILHTGILSEGTWCLKLTTYHSLKVFKLSNLHYCPWVITVIWNEKWAIYQVLFIELDCFWIQWYSCTGFRK